ncbi:MAG TPA: sigma-70 family RNA polymerase sigma factor [Spirochaetota bacterium]|nr:sigma-70 family RNA polymerase sigma factor [Spirochaetota bacterium]HOM38483.1 sigma-70 family RNA polymerase sigma factor [Spirochaetota bacterium]HPQ49023.1 sigma-70 family RNA polymerase sigma factor [Spirochaetota bacterium]
MNGLNEYLNKITSFPLLSPKEERKLFERLRYLEKKVDTNEEPDNNNEYAKEITKIRNKIIKGNLRLVLSIVNKINKSKNIENIIDLFDEGTIGLIEAVDKFSLDENVKFSTYAYWWIKQRIKASIISTPNRLSAPLSIYSLAYRIKNYLEIKRGASYEEIADDLKVSVDKVKNALPLISKLKYLDQPVEDNEDIKYSDLLYSEYDSIKEKEREWIIEFINEFLENNIFPLLKENQVIVIKNRYGFNPERKEFTLKEISEKLNLSIERVRQIEKEAIMIMREIELIYILKELLSYNLIFI